MGFKNKNIRRTLDKAIKYLDGGFIKGLAIKPLNPYDMVALSKLRPGQCMVCAVGALNLSCGFYDYDSHNSDYRYKIKSKLDRAAKLLGYSGIIQLNDSHNTTVEDVKRAFNIAKEMR